MRGPCRRPDHGQNPRARAAPSAGGSQQRARLRAAHDAHFGDAPGQRPLGGFELQNHPAGNLVPADQVFDVRSAHRAQHLLAVEHPRHVGHENQPVGADEFRRGRGHVVGIDVVKLAIGAQPHARSDRNNSRAPKRAQKIHIHLRQIADESQPALPLIELHRLGQKAGGVARADSHGRLSGERNRARQLLIEQPAEDHDGRVARFAIGDAQPADEPALDSHARERGRENFPAAVNHQNLVARPREFRDLPRERLHVFIALQQRSCNLDRPFS